MDFILGIILILLIIFIMFNYISISITNNDKTNYLYSPRKQMNNNNIYLSSHNKLNNNTTNNNLNTILNLKEDSFNYNKYFYL
jgi:hypothetical protein